MRKTNSPKKYRTRTTVIKEELLSSPSKRLFNSAPNSSKMSPVAKKLIQITKRKYVRKKKIELKHSLDSSIKFSKDSLIENSNTISAIKYANDKQ